MYLSVVILLLCELLCELVDGGIMRTIRNVLVKCYIHVYRTVVIMTDVLQRDRKWSCEYCTYENWPASKKCVLCRAPKPMQYIDEDAATVEQDIYKMAPLICQDSIPIDASKSSGGVDSNNTRWSSGVDPTAKWTCHMCTYINWPKALRCTQCRFPRQKQSLATLGTPLTRPLNVDVNASPDTTSSARNSPSSPEAAKATNNDKNRSIAGMSTQAKEAKWPCRACTYENWPRAVRCVLCGLPRGDRSGLSEKEMAGFRGSIVSRRRSPPTAMFRGSGGAELADSHGGGATACPSITQVQQERNVTGSVVDVAMASNYTSPKLHQIRNRLRDVDWLWLMACQGIVDGDVHAIEAYLAANGDPARQLTGDECALLGRPSAYAPGYSLVHLAIRFRREDVLSTLLAAGEMHAGKPRKRVPSYAAPDVAAAIVREISSSLRQRKGDFPCYFVMETATFALPGGNNTLYSGLPLLMLREICYLYFI